jgi:RNA polymerase sigma-70 factor (ECF subfamily)
MADAQRGDAEAYRRVLEELLPFVRGVVRARLADAAAAEDVTQEVLLSIHTARHTYRPERPLAPWVRAIARNAVVDHLRRRGRAREVPLDEGAEPVAGEESAPDRADARLSPGLVRALAGLPEAQREAVWLLKVEELSVAEAAARTGTTPGALKLRAHRGYRALRDLLGRSRL